MLCSLLEQTDIAGRPSEFFGPTLFEELLANRSVVHARDISEVMGRIRSTCTSENGVCGIKLLAPQTELFLRRAADDRQVPFASLKDALEAEFPGLRYILLTRENKVAQAISYYRAIINRVWRRGTDEAPRPGRPVAYDHFAIQRCLQECIASDAYWDGYFERHGITAHRVTYEALAADYESEVRRILTFLDLSRNVLVKPPETAKLANEESVAWETEFLEHGRVPEPEPLPPERLWAPY